MKNKGIQYCRNLNMIGILALAVTLLSFFLGCTTKREILEAPEVNIEALSKKQVSSKVYPDSKKQVRSKANPEPIQHALKSALDSTVHLFLKDADNRTVEIGSGFFVRQNLIVTNLHVVEETDSGYYARLVGKKEEYSIKSVVRHEEYGLALLRVAAPGVKPLSIGTVEYRYGIPIYVYVGEHLSEVGKFSKGIITYRSFDNNTINVRPGATIVLDGKVIRGPYSYQGKIEWFGLTTQIHRVNSGGPVLNSKGEIIGVSAQLVGMSGNTGNFSISSETLKSLLR